MTQDQIMYLLILLSTLLSCSLLQIYQTEKQLDCLIERQKELQRLLTPLDEYIRYCEAVEEEYSDEGFEEYLLERGLSLPVWRYALMNYRVTVESGRESS